MSGPEARVLLFNNDILKLYIETMAKKKMAIEQDPHVRLYLRDVPGPKEVALELRGADGAAVMELSGKVDMKEPTFVLDWPLRGKVDGAEKPFELSISNLDVPLVGIIDLVAELGGCRTVVDFKAAGASYKEHEAVLSDQLSAYLLAEPAAEQAAFCVLVKAKEPRIEWHFTRRTGDGLVAFLHKAELLGSEIAAGQFYRRPGKHCSWCDFLPVCTGDRKRAAETLVSATN